ncbi:MAG: S8 family peptidase [Haloferacaceae archaeon]
MGENDLSRRGMIQGVGAVGVIGFVGVPAAGARSREPLDRHIVGVEPGRADVARRAADAVYRVLDFGPIGQAVSGWYPDDVLDDLRRNPNVRYVEPEGEMEAIAQTLPWGVDRVDADRAHQEGETGGDDTDGEGGADISIIDTGIDSDHPDLEANLGEGYAAVSARGPYAEPWDDDNDHGTHCAGIADAIDNDEGVVGVSTAATLHVVKVLDENGSGSFSDVAAGIEWTADQGYDVGSLSLGASSGSQTVEDACQYAHDEGVLLVAAAGNGGPCSDCVGYPAAYETVMAISATTEDDSLASFSSTGPEVELAAPGESIYSTVIGGYDTFSGTSMACPHVSGAGGQLMDNGYTNTEARDRLNSTAEDIGLGENEQGNGLVDVAGALELDSDGGDDTNSAPSCTIVNPDDGETVSGTVTIQVDASDEEDDDTTLEVDVAIDDGDWRETTYDSESGYYEDDWDTTTVDDGDHTVQARATDSDGATTESEQITVTVDNSDESGDDSSDDTAPVVDQFDLTDTSNPRWARVEVDWAVSDDDGDLDTVTTEVTDWNSDSTSDVSGSTASGTHEHRQRDAHGEIDVTLTVTDAGGNSTSETKSITLG